MSNHPLSEDLTKVSTEDLDKKFNELIKRYNIAKRSGMASHVLYQLDLLLEGIEFERYSRLEMELIDKDEDPVVIDTDRMPRDANPFTNKFS
jgi:hypothetical protein